MKYSAADCSGNVRIEGKLHYSSDFMHITGLSSDGLLAIEETDHGTTRRLRATPSGNGLAYAWSVDGHDRPFDAAARAWLDAWTLVLFRELGFAADDRASAMLASGGVDAILHEITYMHSDYVESTYLGVAMERGHLDATQMDRVLTVAGTSIDSDYYASTILSRAAKGVAFNAKTQELYLRAAAKIDSDYYRETVLADLLQNGRLDTNQVAEVLRQGKIIDSDYYRATLLTTVAGKYALDPSLRTTYLAAVSDIESDYYKSEVLQKMAAQRDLSDADIASIIAAGRTIESDYYQSSFLVELAHKHTIRGAARDAFTTAMNGIDSQTYRSSVAEALRSNR